MPPFIHSESTYDIFIHVENSSEFMRVVVVGWSELAPTNAPVADEPVEAVFWMDENPILPA